MNPDEIAVVMNVLGERVMSTTEILKEFHPDYDSWDHGMKRREENRIYRRLKYMANNDYIRIVGKVAKTNEAIWSVV